jgi:hypothetical protein
VPTSGQIDSRQQVAAASLLLFAKYQKHIFYCLYPISFSATYFYAVFEMRFSKLLAVACLVASCYCSDWLTQEWDVIIVGAGSAGIIGNISILLYLRIWLIQKYSCGANVFSGPQNAPDRGWWALLWHYGW